MRFYSTMAAAFLTSFVTAAPTAHVQRSIKLTQCPLSNANDVSLPAAASTVGMSLFEGEKPVHVLLGRGVQVSIRY